VCFCVLGIRDIGVIYIELQKLMPVEHRYGPTVRLIVIHLFIHLLVK